MKGHLRLGMQVFLLRHGIAEEALNGASDAERALTAEGKRKVRRVLALAGELKPDTVLASPLRRTMETAAVAVKTLKLGTQVEEFGLLAPGHSFQDVWSAVAKRRNLQTVLLVGHNPQLSELASFLIGAPRTSLELRKGTLAKIEVKGRTSKPKGTLLWCLTPGLAKRVQQAYI